MRMLFPRRVAATAVASALPTLSIAAPPAAAEGNSGTTVFSFPVTRGAATSVAVSCAWQVTGSGANPATATDFAGNLLPAGTLLFAAGETDKTIAVPVAGDTAIEPDEGFAVTLVNPIGALIGQASAVAIILNDDAPAPFTPAAMATPPLRAWDMRSGVTASGGAASAVAGAWGTAAALTTSGAPPLLAGGGPQPVGGTAPDILGLTAGSSHYATFPALDLATSPGDAEFWFAFGFRGGTSVLAGNPASSTSQIIVNSTGATLSVKTATSGIISVPLPFTLRSGCMYVLRLVYAQASGQFTAHVNGIAGTQTATGTAGSTTGFSVSTIGRGGGSYATIYLAAALIFNAQLSAADAANLNVYLAPFISTTYYAAAAGADTNPGWNQAAPFATVDRFIAISPAQGGATITFAPKGGDVFRRTTAFAVPANVTIDGGLWGTGYAEYRWSTAPADWALVGGTAGVPGCVYARTEAQHPYQGAVAGGGFIWDAGAADAVPLSSLAPTATNAHVWHRQMDQWCAANPAGQRLKDGGQGASPAAGSYGYAGTTLYVALADGGNPNGRVEIAYRTQSANTLQMSAAAQVPNAGGTLRRLRMRYGDASAVQATGDGAMIDRLDVAYFQSDGIDGSGAATKTNMDCRVMYVGNGAADGSDGDGYSNHSTRTNRYRCYSGWADRGGFDDVEYCAADNYGCRAFGQRPFMTPGNGAGDSGRAVQNFWNCIGTLPDGRSYPSLVHNRGAFMNFYGCTLAGFGTPTAKNGITDEVRSGGGSNTPATSLRDCIVTGVARARYKMSSAGSLDEDWNLIVAIGYGDGTPGAHSLAVDPRFAGAASFDYSLAAGSPAKGAGTAIAALTSDYARVARPTPPTMGAFEG